MSQRPKWRIKQKPSKSPIEELANFNPIQQALLFARGIKTRVEAELFLKADKPEFHDPYLLREMEASVDLVRQHIQSGNGICVYGDYDVDGISGAAVMYSFFKENDIQAQVYFPDRFSEGYGLNTSAIRELASQGVRLLISVDCGIRGIEQIQLAHELGMDVVVIDHHIPGEQLPPAAGIVNPKQPGDAYPFKELAGVGVAFKFAQALASRLSARFNQDRLLELVALGTVADMVPLVGENRHLVQQGLIRLNETKYPGLEALIQVSGVQGGSIGSSAIGFNLGPRINAAGRLASAFQAFDLLIAEESDYARKLAEKLDRLNKQRQALTNEVLTKIGEHPPLANEKMILSFDETYHQGVVGLAASRLSDQFFRPAIVGSVGEDETRASARSIPGFHITQALEDVSDLLARYGGHQAAAGFTIKNDLREKFIDRLLEIAEEKIADDLLVSVQEIDLCIGFEAIDDDLMSFLDAMEPFGIQNLQPIFCSENVTVLAKRTVGRDSSHLKLTLERDGRPIDAIGFRLGELASSLPTRVDVAYHIERNYYLGYETLQLRVVDIRPAGSVADERLTEWVEVD